ncbi:hypothetical protein GCM10029992_12780 [Glycomyces albus]
MTTNTIEPRPVKRMVRAVGTVAMAAGLMLGGAAVASAPAAAGPSAGTESTVSAGFHFEGPFAFWDYCQMDRKGAQAHGYEVTPCFKDPDGYYYGIYT